MKTFLSIIVTLAILAVALVQAMPAKAWDCSLYRFSLAADGAVSVTNNSAVGESPQQARVLIDGIEVAVLTVPSLASGDGAVLGAVSLPTGTHSWEIIGTADCRASGTFSITVPPTPPVTPPTPPAPPEPPPPGQTLVCVTIDKGDLWGKLEIWHSNEIGERLTGFDGYAEINADGALTVFANPGESRQGWFLVIDEHGTQALFYIEVGMALDCLSPLNHDCRRIYPQPVERDHDCDCDKS